MDGSNRIVIRVRDDGVIVVDGGYGVMISLLGIGLVVVRGRSVMMFGMIVTTVRVYVQR